MISGNESTSSRTWTIAQVCPACKRVSLEPGVWKRSDERLLDFEIIRLVRHSCPRCRMSSLETPIAMAVGAEVFVDDPRR